MASINISFQLSNAKGLEKIICFDGLGYDLIIHPTIHGEPLLTSQAFYYLKNLDSIAQLNIDVSQPKLNSTQIEYLIDNYLFEYCAINPKSKLTTKVEEYAYWKDDIHSLYHHYDQANTGALIVDKWNDPTVADIQPIDDNVDFSDWCIPKNYTDSIIHEYVSKMQALLDKKVMLFITPNQYRNGYMGKKRIFDFIEGPLDLYQAEQLDNTRRIGDEDEFIIKSSYSSDYDVCIPIERIHCENLYNPLLLSYYFSGLNAKNSLNSFVGFYNVVEYYFEEAPALIGINARFEKEQLKAVIALLTNHNGIDIFLKNQSSSFYTDLPNDIVTSSSINISGFNIVSSDMINELARWLYEIRCAVVHSKKTRKGQTTAIFKPYSIESNNINIAIPIIQWLAILCIKKDFSLGNGKTDL